MTVRLKECDRSRTAWIDVRLARDIKFDQTHIEHRKRPEVLDEHSQSGWVFHLCRLRDHQRCLGFVYATALLPALHPAPNGNRHRNKGRDKRASGGVDMPTGGVHQRRDSEAQRNETRD